MTLATLAIALILHPSSIQGRKDQGTLAKYYAAIAPELKARRAAWDNSLTKLKDASTEFYAPVQAAIDKAGLDTKKLAEATRDAVKRNIVNGKPDEKFESNVRAAMSYDTLTPYIDMAAIERARTKYYKLVPDQTEHDPKKVTKTEADVQTDILYVAPFTDAGMTDRYTTSNSADANTGDFAAAQSAIEIGSVNAVSSIRQAVTIPAGTRQVRVVAEIRTGHNLTVASVIGYASGEDLLNLHVMSGSRVLASDRQSLGRIVSIAVGEVSRFGMRTISLTTSFLVDSTLPPQIDVIADAEAWAGAAGLFAYSNSYINGHLNSIHVYFDR